MTTTDNKPILDRARGSLIGGAVGDALGYAVEFLPLAAIIKQYGEQGITRYDLGDIGIAEFSDDTQMSLFTAEGLLLWSCLLCDTIYRFSFHLSDNSRVV